MTRPNRPQRDERRGAALVEFAVVLPLLMLLLVGSVEVGRAITVRQTLCEASRAGARVYSMTTKKTADDAKAIVDEIMKNAGLKNYKVEISPPPGTTLAQLDPMTVTVSMTASNASWYPNPWFLGGDNLLRASCTMPADLEESLLVDAIDADDAADPLEDDDEVAEFSGVDAATVKELEKEAQDWIKKAKEEREDAEKDYERARKHYKKAQEELADGDDDDYEEEMEDYWKDYRKAKEHERKAAEYEALARDALARAAAATV